MLNIKASAPLQRAIHELWIMNSGTKSLLWPVRLISYSNSISQSISTNLFKSGMFIRMCLFVLCVYTRMSVRVLDRMCKSYFTRLYCC